MGADLVRDRALFEYAFRRPSEVGELVKLFILQTNDNMVTVMKLCTQAEVEKMDPAAKKSVQNLYLFSVFSNEYTSLEEVLVKQNLNLEPVSGIEFQHSSAVHHQNSITTKVGKKVVGTQITSTPVAPPKQPVKPSIKATIDLGKKPPTTVTVTPQAKTAALGFAKKVEKKPQEQLAVQPQDQQSKKPDVEMNAEEDVTSSLQKMEVNDSSSEDFELKRNHRKKRRINLSEDENDLDVSEREEQEVRKPTGKRTLES